MMNVNTYISYIFKESISIYIQLISLGLWPKGEQKISNFMVCGELE